MNKPTNTAKILHDGAVVEVMEDGQEYVIPETPMRSMTEEEIDIAAQAE